MNQLPPESPPPRRRRRQYLLLSPWQFVALSSLVAIAILGGGLGLVRQLTPPKPNTSPTANEEAAQQGDEFVLPTADAPLTTELLPEIASREPVQTKTVAVQKIWKYRYNVAKQPDLTYSESLQVIVEGLKELAIAAKLPPDAMSIVLIDLNRKAIAYHQPEMNHYPASVAKLFWMVALYGQFQQGLLSEADFQDELAQMIRRSDNNATSHIIDAITRTSFQAAGNTEDYQAWYMQRQQLNLFFSLAGYQNLNITQKTYPIPDIKVNEPLGFDLQMRYDSRHPDQPIRNQLSAWDAARMMYEIVTHQAIAPDASQKMLQWLQRDLSKNWQTSDNYFNPIQDFFGAGLPPTTRFYSKAGWTTQGRHEVAYIASPDGKQNYILCIFADQKDYATNQKFFPNAAQFTSQKMQTIQP